MLEIMLKVTAALSCSCQRGPQAVENPEVLSHVVASTSWEGNGHARSRMELSPQQWKWICMDRIAASFLDWNQCFHCNSVRETLISVGKAWVADQTIDIMGIRWTIYARRINLSLLESFRLGRFSVRSSQITASARRASAMVVEGNAEEKGSMNLLTRTSDHLDQIRRGPL